MADEGFKHKLAVILSIDLEGFKGGMKNEMPKMQDRKFWTRSVLS